MTQPNTLSPPAGRKRELEVVAAERVVLDGDAQRGVETSVVAEQVLGDAQPEAEQRRAADHVVVGDDAERAPAVDHRQQAEVVVGQGGVVDAGPAEAELVQDLVFEQRLAGPLRVVLFAEDFFFGAENAHAQLVEVAAEHQLVQLGDALGVLVDLLAGLGVEDGEAGVDVPLLAVDAHG